MRVGSEQTYISLQDQRTANQIVVEASDVPKGSAVIGPVDASRCHRHQGDIEPTNEMVIADLKAAAYARGGDGIAGATIVREVGLQKNCWFILTGRATAFRNLPAMR